MQEQDWALLGIAPTAELAAIKKAYALKLRVTRPDDDAQAYQALRGAYERAQRAVQSDEPVRTDEAALHPPQREESSAAGFGGPPSPPVEPQDLIDELQMPWLEGPEALLNRWPTVRDLLDEQPLTRRAEFSAAFARWAATEPELPDALLRAMETHFGWRTDFRIERQLGPELSQALHEALEWRLRAPPITPAIRAVAEPLLRLYELSRTGSSWWYLQLWGFLLQPTLARRQKMLDANLLRRLGLGRDAQDGLKELALHGLWLRIGLTGLAGLVIAGTVADNAFVGMGHAFGWFLCMGGLMYAGWAVGTIMLFVAHSASPSPRGSAMGLGMLLLAAFTCHAVQAQGGMETTSALALAIAWLAALVLTLAGLALSWPAELEHAAVVATLAPFVGWLSVGTLGAWLPTLSCVLIGAAWLLAATAIHEERLPLPGAAPLRWLMRPVLNPLVVADRWTYATAMTPMSIGVAWTFFNEGQVDTGTVFMIWILSTIGLAWLQRTADERCVQWLPPLSPSES